MAKGVALLLVAILMTSTAIGANLIGQASVIDGDTIEIHGTRTAYGASTHPNTINCAVTKIAYAARNPRMRSMHPSHNGLQSANRARWISTAERLQHAASAVLISANG